MTNEQLAILLDNLRARLADALQEVDDSLPEGVGRSKIWQYRGGGSFFERMISRPSTHPEDWEQSDGQALLLDPLETVLSDLGDYVELLKTEKTGEDDG